jgi:hypothetical protein
MGDKEATRIVERNQTHLDQIGGITATFAQLVESMGGGENGIQRAKKTVEQNSAVLRSADVLGRFGELAEIMVGDKERARSVVKQSSVVLQSADVLGRFGELTEIMGGDKERARKSPKKAKKPPLRCGALSTDALFTIGGDDAAHALVKAELVRRPSARNRSPYVADIRLADGREAICHVPSFDLGGKCVAGSAILVKPALDATGRLVGPNAVSPKYGTPKCEFHCQLAVLKGGGYVGAHPSLGETAAVALLQRSPVLADVWAGARADAEIRREVTAPRAQDMRADFVVSGGGAKETVLEVKTVVDASVDAGVDAGEEGGPVVALFPWGKKNQKGPAGEKVVSARAIKHVDALAAIQEEGVASAAVLFVVARADAAAFRPHAARCPSFAAHLEAAKAAGVNILARRLRWDVRGGVALAFDDGAIPVDV